MSPRKGPRNRKLSAKAAETAAANQAAADVAANRRATPSRAANQDSSKITWSQINWTSFRYEPSMFNSMASTIDFQDVDFNRIRDAVPKDQQTSDVNHLFNLQALVLTAEEYLERDFPVSPKTKRPSEVKSPVSKGKGKGKAQEATEQPPAKKPRKSASLASNDSTATICNGLSPVSEEDTVAEQSIGEEQDLTTKKSG